jgi:hypothetical protein
LGALAWIPLVLVIGLAFWIPAEILRKAGFSRWLALAIPLTGYLALAIFAFVEWPIERERAWLRFRCGEDPDELKPQVEGYALDLERRGSWPEAAEVYSELLGRSTSEEQAMYYRNLLQRLRERMEDPYAA